MAISVQGCCSEALHSLGQDCDLNAVALTDLAIFNRYRDGIRAGVPTNASNTAPDTIGEAIAKQVAQTSTDFNYLYPFPKPTQIMFAPSDETSTDDPVGYSQNNGGGNIYMATVLWTGDKATSLLKKNLEDTLKNCGSSDVIFGDDNGAIVGQKKAGNDDLLYGFQIQRSTVKIKFEQAVKGSDVNKLTLTFQVLKEPVKTTYMAVIPADVLGYGFDELEPLRLYTGRASVVSTTVLSVQFIADSADATKKLYLKGFTGSAPQVLKLENLTDNTSTTIASGSIVEVPVADDLVTNTVGTSYTVTITAATTGDQLRLVASGIEGYEPIISNTVTAL